MIDATTALLNALRREFASLMVTIEAIRSKSWEGGLYTGADHDVTVRLDGREAAEKAAVFAATPDLDLRGHLIAELDVVGHEAVTGTINYARLTLRVKTIEDLREPRAIAEPDPYPAGALTTYENRRGEPWFLIGFPSGEVAITNAVPHPDALRLYRFRTEAQARAGAEVLVGNAQLFMDGETWFVGDVRREEDRAAACRALLIWAALMDQQLGRRLRGLGSGHYSVAYKAVAPRAVTA